MIDLRDPNHVDMVRGALRDWLPGQAQMVLDLANHRITNDTDWLEDDDFATQCEQLAVVARKIAEIGHALAFNTNGAVTDDAVHATNVDALHRALRPGHLPDQEAST